MSAAFAAQLLAAARTPDVTHDTFVQGIDRGRYSKTALRTYAQELAALANGFPHIVIILAARTENRSLVNAEQSSSNLG